jgi:hypothetical protein
MCIREERVPLACAPPQELCRKLESYRNALKQTLPFGKEAGSFLHVQQKSDPEDYQS